MKKPKTKLKPKEKQATLSTGEVSWTDKPLDSAYAVRNAVGFFFEELFAFVFGFRRVKSSELPVIPDIQSEHDVPIFGEIKASNYRSQFKLNPEQLEEYRKLLDGGDAQAVEWVFVIHKLLNIAKTCDYESDVYRKLAENVVGAVTLSQESVEELVERIPIKEFRGEWGKLRVIPSRFFSYLWSDNGQKTEAKEYFELKRLRVTRREVAAVKVFGYDVAPFPFFKVICKSRAEDDPF